MFVDFVISRCRRGAAVVAIANVLAGADVAHAQAAVAPLTLRDVLDVVRTSHPMALAAERRTRAAEGSLTTARTFGNPILAYQVDQTPFPGAKSIPDMEREAMTTATLPLENLYQRGPRVARAKADVRAAEASTQWTRQQLALDAAAAFYRVGLAQIQSATTHDLLGWLDTLVTYNRHRVDEGAAAEADLIRSEVERDRVAAEAAMQDAELAKARAALGTFAPTAPSAPADLRVTVDDVPLPMPADVNGVTLAAGTTTIDRRGDVRAARERVSASNAAIASERAMLFRQLGATLGTMVVGHTTTMVAGVSLPFPIFDQNRGEIQRASAERDAATFELAAQERTAAAELAGAYEAARILTDRALALGRRDSTGFLARADESLHIALGTYREGAVPLFQVIDAARSWADARTTYYRTIATQHQTVLALLVAQGLDLFTAVPGGSLR
jgi:cobalt-zinc-cadmium efflux system outer membrane protein